MRGVTCLDVVRACESGRRETVIEVLLGTVGGLRGYLKGWVDRVG